MRLLRVELRRFYSRRLTKFAALGILIILGFVLFGIQQQAYESVPSRVQERTQQQVQSCNDAQSEARKSDASADFHCQDVAAQIGGQGETSFVSLTKDFGQSLALLFAFVGFLIGTAFFAAEFATGAIGNWLTFEPRRQRVYFSKVSAAALGSIPLTVAALGVLSAGVYVITRSYDIVGTTTGAQAVDLTWTAVRIIAVTAAATIGGSVLGSLFRNTAAALGVALGYAIVIEGIVPGLIQRLVPDLKPWLVQPNFQAWVQHGATYFVDTCQDAGNQMQTCENVQRVVTFGHGATYLGVLVTVFVALGAWVFNRRDVT